MVSGSEISEFRVHVPDGDLADLRARLDRTRWPDQLPNEEWRGGAPVARVRELAERWRTGFDWRGLEARLGEFPQFTTVVEGQTIHFLWVRSGVPGALPLLATHGWPGSFLEFADLAGPLSGHDEAFDLVVPSIPGFGFSPLSGPGWNGERVARAWTVLMARLGYERYGVHGGDLGAGISRRVARLAPRSVVGVHVNYLPTPPSGAAEEGLSPQDDARLAGYAKWAAEFGAYEHLQRTRPQSLSYALTDSPTGLLAWIIERFHDWTDPRCRDRIGDDVLLADIALYWLTGTAGSAAQFYRENALAGPVPGRGVVPTGVSCFPYEIVLPVRALAERSENIVWWREHAEGGHFPALEVPGTLGTDLRDFFRPLRS
ncbi:epoxide hydrolase family protein [Nonomuraea glycinis]|uniref:epoxide hydrolase family protein n=1 Tax=Nonomuraea glycinis TaxID=2047744 RepID=UPI0033B16217